MIKGHAVVELKDAVTGEVQRVEHDNMVTNGLKYALTPWLGKFSFAGLGSSPQFMTGEDPQKRKDNNKSIMNHLLGGIFLFQNNLAEDADNVDFPLDNPLTGKASWNAYSGMDACRGSYNESESGLQEDGSYKHVWDFATNQANGQISALALTTYKGGICGNGFKEWDDKTETAIKESPFFNLGEIKINNPGEGTDCPPFIRASSNEIYYVAAADNLQYSQSQAGRHLGSAKKLFLKKIKFPLSRLSPFYDYYNQYLSEDIAIEIPEDFAAYAAKSECRGKASDSYLYIYKQKNITAGEQFRFLRIRKSDLQADVITLTNNTPSPLSLEKGICFTDEFFFVNTSEYANGKWTYNICRISLTDNDVVQESSSIAEAPQRIGGYIYEISSNGHTLCINPKTWEIKRHPDGSTISNRKLYDTENIAPGVYLQFARNIQTAAAAYDYACIYISAIALMTINNLPSPVTKTAAQTMKVTYIIQETEE